MKNIKNSLDVKKLVFSVFVAMLFICSVAVNVGAKVDIVEFDTKYTLGDYVIEFYTAANDTILYFDTDEYDTHLFSLNGTTGIVTVYGNITVGDFVLSDLLPNPSLTHSLGSGPNRWLSLFVADVSSDNLNATVSIGTVGDLWVGGDFDLEGDFDLAGDTTITGNLTVEENLTVDENLYISGITVMGADGFLVSPTDTGASIRFNVTTGGDVYMAGTFTNDGNMNIADVLEVIVTGDDRVTIDAPLYLENNTVFFGNFTEYMSDVIFIDDDKWYINETDPVFIEHDAFDYSTEYADDWNASNSNDDFFNESDAYVYQNEWADTWNLSGEGFWNRDGTDLYPSTDGDNIKGNGTLAISPNTDVTTELGRVKIGFISGYADEAFFSHYDMDSISNFALCQTNDGTVYLNSPTNKFIYLTSNGVDYYGRFDTDEFNFHDTPLLFGHTYGSEDTKLTRISEGTLNESSDYGDAFFEVDQVNATGGNSIEWTDAYDWGDHSLIGYLTSTLWNRDGTTLYTATDNDDVQVNGTGTFTGDVDVANDLIVQRTIYVAQDVVHLDDVHTGMLLEPDRFRFQAGGVGMLDFIEDTKDVVRGNPYAASDTTDVDFEWWQLNTETSFFTLDAFNAFVGVNKPIPEQPLDVVGNTNITGDVNITGGLNVIGDEYNTFTLTNSTSSNSWNMYVDADGVMVWEWS